MHLFLLVFLAAFFSTYFLTPFIRKFAVSINAVDVPNSRKVHLTPIPRLGGLAIYLGFFIAFFVSLLFAALFEVKINYLFVFGIFLGGSLMVLVGAIDDIKGMKANAKLFWQVIAALIVISCGANINFLTNPFNGMLVIGWLGIPLALLWIVGITNAMNLIDGLDGLATGVCAIASITLFFVAIRTHQIGAAIILLSLAGSSLGFLRYNFSPATIFLGDSGSMFLGIILASASIVGVLKTTLVVAMVIPILILGVPIFDTLFAIGRRVKSRSHLFEADNKHIHHMLLRAGFDKREAVLAIYIACFILSFMALVMALTK